MGALLNQFTNHYTFLQIQVPAHAQKLSHILCEEVCVCGQLQHCGSSLYTAVHCSKHEFANRIPKYYAICSETSTCMAQMSHTYLHQCTKGKFYFRFLLKLLNIPPPSLPHLLSLSLQNESVLQSTLHSLPPPWLLQEKITFSIPLVVYQHEED